MKSVQIQSFFWPVFFCIRIEYGDLLRKSLYSVRIQENTDQKQIHIGHFHAMHILTKIITFLKICKNKSNAVVDTFFNIADISIYLIFKLSVRKRVCTISFEPQIPDFIDRILESSYKVILRKVKIETLQQPA